MMKVLLILYWSSWSVKKRSKEIKHQICRDKKSRRMLLLCPETWRFLGQAVLSKEMWLRMQSWSRWRVFDTILGCLECFVGVCFSSWIGFPSFSHGSCIYKSLLLNWTACFNLILWVIVSVLLVRLNEKTSQHPRETIQSPNLDYVLVGINISSTHLDRPA